MFDHIIATAHQINLSLMRNNKYMYGGATTLQIMYDYEELLLLIHGRADHM